MKILTGSYCGDAADAALVLVRGRRIGDDLPVAMVGVWEGGTEFEQVKQKRFGDILLEWFDEQGLTVCTKGVANKCIKAMGKNFIKWYKNCGQNKLNSLCQKTSWSILVCVGEECFYAWNGDAEMHLLNLCFNRLNRRKLTWYTDDLQLEFAGLEQGIGILLVAKSFLECLSEDGLKECLAIESMESCDRIERHLKEVALEAESRGAKHPIAVLVVTR